tara:strand:- start:512 stop:952 length:441 start_codon:yes stop_codon:yes gene_type:complete
MVSVSNVIAILQCDAAVDAIDGGAGAGTLVLYSGTPPTNVDTALAGNTVLATLTFSDPAFGAASDQAPGAMATASAITDDSSADATGDATFARAFDSNALAVLQFTVAGSTGGSAEILVTSADADAGITIGLPVSISSFTYTQPES